MKGKRKNKTKGTENQSTEEKRKKATKKKYSEYEPKGTRTEIYNEGLGIDMIINI